MVFRPEFGLNKAQLLFLKDNCWIHENVLLVKKNKGNTNINIISAFCARLNCREQKDK